MKETKQAHQRVRIGALRVAQDWPVSITAKNLRQSVT